MVNHEGGSSLITPRGALERHAFYKAPCNSRSLVRFCQYSHVLLCNDTTILAEQHG
jgi:hypothetical protein